MSRYTMKFTLTVIKSLFKNGLSETIDDVGQDMFEDYYFNDTECKTKRIVYTLLKLFQRQ